MATYTFKSNTYSGRYLQLTITETVNLIGNYSTLAWTLKSTGGSNDYYSIAPTTVKINGTTVYSKGATSYTDHQFPAAKGSVSGTVKVVHDSDGRKTGVEVVFDTRVYYSTANSFGGSIDLTKIDRSAPTVTLATSNIDASSVRIEVTASTTANRWWFSTNGGSSWVEFDSTDGTSKTHTITGLKPNTSYSIQICARKKANNVDGYSGKASIKTLGGSVISSVSAFTADVATAKITMSVTVYNTSYTHTLVIKNGSTSVLTITGLSLSNGSNTITLTAAQRSTVLAAMSNLKSFTGTFTLTTYSGSTQIGTASSNTATVQTTQANSGPIFTDSAGFTYQDSNSVTSDVTGDDQLLIQDYSTLAVTAYEATARNGASIKKYEATIDDTIVSSTGTALNLGKVSKSGNLTLTVKVIDSRGYSAEVKKTITVIAYKKIDISDDNTTMRRVNEVEAITQVNFEAVISKILVSSENKNAFQVLKYRYKKTSESSYGPYMDISSAVNALETSVTYESDEFVSLDPDYSYHVEFYVSDKITSDTFVVPLSAGTPLISKRKKKIGINNRNPQAALDIVGGFVLDGERLVDFIVEQGTQGIWTYRKWSSGIAECWGRTSVTTAFNGKWSETIYVSDEITLAIAYPFAFIEKPIEIAQLSLEANSVWIYSEAGRTNTAEQCGQYHGARATALTNSQIMIADIQVKGRWK